MKNKMIGGAKPNIKINKVFGIGLTKTGTHSVNHALNLLGFKSIHNCKEKNFINDLRSGNFSKMKLLKENDALTHIEASAFFEQFDIYYPNSKFILTIREDRYANIDKWLDSCRRHEMTYWTDKTKMPTNSGNYYMNSVVYGVHKFIDSRYRYIYERHNREVVHYFSDKNGKLLIVNIQTESNEEISEAICKFLGVPVNIKVFKQIFENKKIPAKK